MAAKTWAAAGNGNWSDGANWGGSAPTSGDTVTFDATSDFNCAIDNLGTFAGSVTIASGYDGTISQNSGVNISWGAFSMADDQAVFTCHSAATYTGTTFSVTAGTFNQGGAFVCTTFGCTGTGIFVGSSATMSTTAVTFSNTANLTATSGIWTLAGSFTKSNSPTFSANGGTINITALCTFNAASLTFNLITVNSTGSLTVSSSTTVPLGSSPTTTCGTSSISISSGGVVSASGVWAHTGGIDNANNGTISGAITDINITNGAFLSTSGSTQPSGVNIKMTNTAATTRSFWGGTKTYGTLWWTNSHTGGILSIQDSSTFTEFKDNDGAVSHTILFQGSTTQTISTLTLAGASGKLITMRPASVNATWTLTTASGAKTADYVVIQNSTVDASPTWTAGSNSSNGGGNTNWLFTAASAGGGGGGANIRGGGAFASKGGRRFP